MTPNLPPTVPRLRSLLAAGIAAAIVASAASGQPADADTLRRLQEENANLRQRIAELEGRAAPVATPAPAAPATSAAPSPQAGTSAPATRLTAAAPATSADTVVLSPFEVSSEKDYGYLRTNSATATRIGTAIQNVPLNISVLSEDFIRDTGMRDIQDVLRYTAASGGDTRMGVLQPATGATPSGGMTLRGFPINSRLRNGVVRYTAYNLDNVERVELIKGPAAVFFGQGYPGGVINYVTKRPQFTELPTVLTYGYGGNEYRMGTQRATLDHNSVLNDKAALRVVGGWDNAKGAKRFEFQDGFSVTPSLALVPFASGKLRIIAEVEQTRRQRNLDDNSWIYPEQWFADYANPRPELIAASGVANAAAYRARINTSLANWIADVRRAANDQQIPLYTDIDRGAYYTDRNGQRVHDQKFNYYGPGTFSDEEVTTGQVSVELSPIELVDLRYVYTRDTARYSETKAAATPNADGATFNTLGGLIKRDYLLESDDHQIDIVLKKDFARLKNKLLFGGVLRTTSQAFTGTPAVDLSGSGAFPYYGSLPGASSDLSAYVLAGGLPAKDASGQAVLKPQLDPSGRVNWSVDPNARYSATNNGGDAALIGNRIPYVSPVPFFMQDRNSVPNNPATQWVYDRNGNRMLPTTIFTQYDPAVHPFPDVRRITEIQRAVVDKYKPKREDFYINYQGTLLDDRLNVFGGYRKEKLLPNGGQLVDANPPWYTGFPDAVLLIPVSEYPNYGFGTTGAYAKDQLRHYESSSYMAGLSFAVTADINVYTSWSQTGVINTGTRGGSYDEVAIRSRSLALGLNPETEAARLRSQGGEDQFEPEKGLNLEAGVKLSLWNQKLVATGSIFRADRENRKLDDTQRTNDEPLNYTGPGRTGAFNRIVRWYGNDAHQRTEGAEFDMIWTPIRNYQAVINGSYMWTAETVADPSILPSSPLHPIVFGNRLPNAPEYRFNVYNKYTFNESFINGLSIGLGARYASEMNISLDQNFNPGRGGLTAGDYLVFDTNISYPWKLFGYRVSTSLNVGNLLDEEYSEGGFNLSPARSWMLTNSLTF